MSYDDTNYYSKIMEYTMNENKNQVTETYDVYKLIKKETPDLSDLNKVDKFPSVTLIGSTKFKKEFDEARENVGRMGWIVYSVTYFSHTKGGVCMYGHMKRMFDKLYLQQIRQSDICLVINKDGYIGMGAWDEILYAVSINKPVYFLEPISSEASYLLTDLALRNGSKVSSKAFKFAVDPVKEEAEKKKREFLNFFNENKHEIMEHIATTCHAEYELIKAMVTKPYRAPYTPPKECDYWKTTERHWGVPTIQPDYLNQNTISDSLPQIKTCWCDGTMYATVPMTDADADLFSKMGHGTPFSLKIVKS